MTNRQEFMFKFGAGCTVLVGGILTLVLPWWVAAPIGCAAGVGGVLFAPRSKLAITASEVRELSEAAQGVSEEDWQTGSELEGENWS